MNNIYSSHVLLEACKVTDQVRRSIHFGTDYRETDEAAAGETMKILNSYAPIHTLLRRQVLKCLSWHMVVNFCTYQSAHECGGHGLLMVNFATGCIFDYDAQHPEGCWIGFRRKTRPISPALSI